MKNILIITQKVDQDDDVLGFFVAWIEEFSKKFDKVTVICLKMGKYSLPSNVNVLSLGKEKSLTKLEYLFNFYRYIVSERDNYDSVFVHMNPKYVVLGGIFWKLTGKKVSLWYAAKANNTLKLAEKLTDIIFTSTAEGCRINSRKIKIIGQGIDVNKFKPQGVRYSSFKVPDPLKIVSVGRISPSKDYETLIKAVEILIKGNMNLRVEIAGQPATEKDHQYLKILKKSLEDKKMTDFFKFIGPIANKELPPFLQSADLFVNMSHTGSLDKAILEAMACGLTVLTCNEALENVLGFYKDTSMYPKKDSIALANKISFILSMPPEERAKLSSALRDIVIKDHNLDGFIQRLSAILL